MLQKYVISIDRSKNQLNIREYAVIDKFQKKEVVSTLNINSYSFLCEETYESEVVMGSIRKGVNALVATLRTDNFFPIGSYAVKIADSVTALYKSPEGSPVQVLFNDKDLTGS
jgi:hypothetical protein